MSAVLRPLAPLLAAVFLLLVGTGTLSTVLGARLALRAAEPMLIGVVMACYFAGLTLGSLAMHRLIDAVGHPRAFSALAAVLAAAALGHGLGDHPALWGALRFVAGGCMAGLFVCIESWLNRQASAATRGLVLSVYMIVLYGGQGLGQLLLAADTGGAEVFMVVAILVSLALVPVALTRQSPAPSPNVAAAVARLGVGRLAAASPLAVFGTVMAGVITGAVYALGPAYALASGLDTTRTSLFMAAVLLGGMVLQWPAGRLSDRIGRRAVLTVLFTLLAALCGAMGLLPVAGWAVLAGGAAFGALSLALYPLCVAHLNDRLDPRDMVAAGGVMVLGYSAGATVGPFAGSAAMEALGPAGLFLLCAVVALLSAVLGGWRMMAPGRVPVAKAAAKAGVADRIAASPRGLVPSGPRPHNPAVPKEQQSP